MFINLSQVLFGDLSIKVNLKNNNCGSNLNANLLNYSS